MSDSLATKQVEAVLREARSLLRRADKLQAAALALDDLHSSRLAMELAKTASDLVDVLARVRVEGRRRAKRSISKQRS